MQRREFLGVLGGAAVAKKLMAAAVVCATSNFPCIHLAPTEGVICGRALE
jgi:hypothetical protein